MAMTVTMTLMVPPPRMPVVVIVMVMPVFDVMDRAAVAMPAVAGIRRLRQALADDGTDGATEAATDDCAVATAHRIANDGTGDGADATTDGGAEGVGTGGSGKDERSQRERKDETGGFHDSHLRLVLVRQR